jgi:hypothetical protein
MCQHPACLPLPEVVRRAGQEVAERQIPAQVT